jgi:hypothetical protein
MCCDSRSARNGNKPGYMRGTPRILRYIRAERVCKNAQVRTIRREGRFPREIGTLRDCTPGSDARRAG